MQNKEKIPLSIRIIGSIFFIPFIVGVGICYISLFMCLFTLTFDFKKTKEEVGKLFKEVFK